MHNTHNTHNIETAGTTAAAAVPSGANSPFPRAARNHDYRNVARITGKTGKDGEVRAEPLDQLPFLLRPGMRVFLTPPALTGPRVFEVQHVAEQGDAWVVKFAGCDDSATAFKLVGRLCLVASSDLPQLSVEEDPLQLVGLPVVDVRRGPIGEIVDVMVAPAQITLAIAQAQPGAHQVLVPLVDEFVLGVAEGACGEEDGDSGNLAASATIEVDIPDDLWQLNR